MKTSVASGSFAVSRYTRLGIALALGCAILPSDFVRADTWIGNPAEDLPFGDGANWSSGDVPLAADATIDNGGGAVISATDGVIVSRINVGLTTQGNRLIQHGGETAVSGPIMIGFGAGSSGSYTVTDATIFAGGTGANDNTTIGRGGGTGTMTLTNSMLVVNSGEFFVGQGAGSQGTLTLTDSELSATNWIAIGRGGGVGNATLNGASKLYTNGGGFVVGAPVGGVSTGTLTINGTSEAYFDGGAAIFVGESSNGTVNVNDSGKFYSKTGGVWVGHKGGGNGTLNINGGEVFSGGESYIGNEGGTGVVNLTGTGVFRTETEKFVISRWGGLGTVNVDGDAKLSIGGEEIVVAENANAFLNIRGNGQVIAEGAAMNIYIGGGQFTDPARAAANGTTTMDGGVLWAKSGEVVLALPGNGTGLLQVNGGIVRANAIRKGAGTATVNFNGGTVEANIDSTDYFPGFGAGQIVLQTGGMRFNTNSHGVTITQGLGGEGGLSKLGTGTLTLTGVHTFTGAVSVEGGTLAIATGGAIDGASWVSVGSEGELALASNVSLHEEIVLFLVDGAEVALNFDGTATVAALWINDAAVAPDEYTLDDLNALAGTVLFSGNVDAILDVTSTVPEPGVVALLLAGGAAVTMLRLRRKA